MICWGNLCGENFMGYLIWGILPERSCPGDLVLLQMPIREKNIPITFFLGLEVNHFKFVSKEYFSLNGKLDCLFIQEV